MPNTCENCTHWRRQAARPEAVTTSLGECRANPPAVSYQWPRTHATDFCSCHSSRDRKPETGNRKLRTAEKELPIG